MKKHPLPRLMVALAVSFLLTLVFGTGILAQGGGTILITSPTDQAVVSDVITVTGVIDFPNFLKYELFLKTGNELIWGATVYTPVINGDLAILDTKTFLDGTYQLIIRKVTSDSNYTDFTGPTFIIENNLGAPLPFPEIESSPLYPPQSGALARVRNCSGNTLEFDYISPDGSCSAADLRVEPKLENSPTCPYVDVLLTPCEYRGTAIGLGEPKGATYSFVAEAGKIYELTYPGGDRLFIGEAQAHSQTGSDAGSLDPNASTTSQPGEAAVPAAAAPAPTAAPTLAAAVAAPTAPASSPNNSLMLPVSGHGSESKTPFVVAAGSLILFLIVGGVVAVRKRSYPT